MFAKILAALKGWKTILASVITFVLVLLEAREVIDLIPPGLEKWLALAVTVLMAFMRTITNTSVGESE